MSQTSSPYLKAVAGAKDQKAEIIKWIGKLDGIELYGDDVLVAVYARPDKTGNVFLPESEQTEDLYQGKVGLVLKCGPDAFSMTKGGFTWDPSTEPGKNPRPKIHDWVGFNPADAQSIGWRHCACRIISSRQILMKVSDPATIF